jgi:hypothetical protein
MKAVLDIEVPCPVSGLKLNGVICQFHKVPLMMLDNGTIMSYCPNHLMRCFISERITCSMNLKDAVVVQRIEKHVKGRRNGSSERREA